MRLALFLGCAAFPASKHWLHDSSRRNRKPAHGLAEVFSKVECAIREPWHQSMSRPSEQPGNQDSRSRSCPPAIADGQGPGMGDKARPPPMSQSAILGSCYFAVTSDWCAAFI